MLIDSSALQQLMLDSLCHTRNPFRIHFRTNAGHLALGTIVVALNGTVRRLLYSLQGLARHRRLELCLARQGSPSAPKSIQLPLPPEVQQI